LLIGENGREREVTFVAAHLAAHEYHFYRRNADFQCLVQNLVFPDQTGIFKPNTPLFFLGDLNYRLSVLHPSRSGTKLSITPADDEPLDDLSLIEKLKEAILDFLETGRFHKLVPHDQLPLSPLALHLFEAPINFGPTYKYVSHDPPTYANNRTPSWTDRILYSPETIKTTDYKPTTSATFSDHQAVSLTASLHEEDFAMEDGIMPWPINQNWRRRREFADKLAYVAGTMEIMGESKIGGSLFSVMVLGAVLYFYYYS
jgi:endonuclease/exonuclease/phosphatase family metal-dependent hydrolase